MIDYTVKVKNFITKGVSLLSDRHLRDNFCKPVCSFISALFLVIVNKAIFREDELVVLAITLLAVSMLLEDAFLFLISAVNDGCSSTSKVNSFPDLQQNEEVFISLCKRSEEIYHTFSFSHRTAIRREVSKTINEQRNDEKNFSRYLFRC